MFDLQNWFHNGLIHTEIKGKWYDKIPDGKGWVSFN